MRIQALAFAACLLLLALTDAVAQAPGPSAPLPNVRLLATGGTIAGAGQGSGYRAGVVPIGDIVRAVPGLAEIANVDAEQVANIPSPDADEHLWRKLVSRILSTSADPGTAGIVVTHGTDTLEETAFFLSLVVPAGKPVVLVGSMRPATAVSADGPRNLIAAVRVAGAASARDRGVMVVMNDTIFSPMSVTKVVLGRVDAFAAPTRGPIGTVLTDPPRFFAKPAPHAAAFTLGPAPLPRVAIAYAYAGVGGDDIRAVARGADALVIAGVGSGAFSAGARQAVKELTARGMPVVRSHRLGSGDVPFNPASTGDFADQALGTIAGRELNPAKARILLLLALQQARTRDELQALFDAYGAATP